MGLLDAFYSWSNEMPGRQPDMMRFYAEAYKYQNDVSKVPIVGEQPLIPLSGTYNDRNNETTGAVTAS